MTCMNYCHLEISGASVGPGYVIVMPLLNYLRK